MNNKEYADGLRELADWIEANPDIEVPDKVFQVYSMNTKEEASKCLSALKPCRKEYRNDMFHLVRDFGPLTLDFVFYRNAVCTRRVVGTKEIGTELIPARLIPEQIIPAHVEEIVEWECGEPLLKPVEEPAVVEA
jgi:hypothetical protein